VSRSLSMGCWEEEAVLMEESREELKAVGVMEV
jgi:hypothetical protein